MYQLIAIALLLVWRECSSLSTFNRPYQIHFVPRSPTYATRRSSPTKSLFSTQLPSKDEADSLKQQSYSLLEQARRTKIEAEKMESELALTKIAKLEKTLSEKELDLTSSELKSIRNDIINLARLVDPSIKVPDLLIMTSKEKLSDHADATVPRPTYAITEGKQAGANVPRRELLQLSEENLEDAVTYFVSLPRAVRMTLASVVQLDLDRTDPAVIIVSLYELSDMIPVETFVSTYNTYLAADYSKPKNESDKIGIRSVSNDRKVNEQIVRDVSDLLGKTPEEYRTDSIVESLLPRVTRNKGKEPTVEDVNLFVKLACGKETFMLSAAPEKIPGGFLIRGNNQLRDGSELIHAIDSKLQMAAPDWIGKFQASFIVDPTRSNIEESSSVDGDPVLIITSADFTPTTNRLLLTAISSVSLFLTFIFCLATFGSNDIVMQRLTEANNIGNYDTAWFNDLISPLGGALAIIQLFHECGHLFFASKDGFKISAPTILPLITLPYLSFQRRLKTSPPDLSSLFNFAYAGPALGILASAVFLFFGLKLSLTMDSTALQYTPSLPVGLLRLSTLGGEVIDYFLGGNGLILLQDPSTPVPLHPFAIAGFSGLLINAIDCLPIGSTDGGRLSQSLLGRTGHLVFSSIVFTGLFLYTLFSGHREIFVTYLILNSFAEKDVEVPCRNEIDQKADIPQVIACLALWIIAALILAPL